MSTPDDLKALEVSVDVHGRRFVLQPWTDFSFGDMPKLVHIVGHTAGLPEGKMRLNPAFGFEQPLIADIPTNCVVHPSGEVTLAPGVDEVLLDVHEEMGK